MLQRQVHRDQVMLKTGIISEHDNEAHKFAEEIQAKKLASLENGRKMREEAQKQLELLREMKSKKREQAQLRMQQILKRKWEQIMDKITYSHSDPDYYKNCPISPGLGFFKDLLKRSKGLDKLRLNIPDLILVTDDLRWVYTDPETGKVVLRKQFQIYDVYESFSHYKEEENSVVAVWRMTTENIDCLKPAPLTWLEFGEKVMKGALPNNCLIQRFMECNGSRPAITRVFYVNYSKKNKASYAYSITNTAEAMKKYSKASWVLCSDAWDGIEIMPVKGQAMNLFIPTCYTLCEFMQRNFSVRIKMIVLDFIKDTDGNIWLLGCKGFKLDQAALDIRRLKLEAEATKSSAQIAKENFEKREERLSAMHCKLCLLPYKSFEMEKVLPFKMLLLYKQHTQRSGRKLLDLSHLRVTAVDFLSHWLRVCNLCYMLVIHEYELMEVETKLAKIMNVPVKPQDLMSHPSIEHPAFMPAVMTQWRILFYIREMEYSSIIDATAKNLYLHYKIFDNHYSYKLSPYSIRDTTVSYNITRLYYFLGMRDLKVKKFCSKLEMQLWITKGNELTSVIAHAKISPLKFFSGEMPFRTAFHEPVEVIFFRDDEQYMNMKMSVGLACDSDINVKTLPINIRRYMGLYFPEESYFNSDPLPNEWMELFDDAYKGLNNTRILDSSHELEEVYSPKLNKDEMLTPPIGSTKVLHLNFNLDPTPKSKTTLAQRNKRQNMTRSERISKEEEKETRIEPRNQRPTTSTLTRTPLLTMTSGASSSKPAETPSKPPVLLKKRIMSATSKNRSHLKLSSEGSSSLTALNPVPKDRPISMGTIDSTHPLFKDQGTYSNPDSPRYPQSPEAMIFNTVEKFLDSRSFSKALTLPRSSTKDNLSPNYELDRVTSVPSIKFEPELLARPTTSSSKSRRKSVISKKRKKSLLLDKNIKLVSIYLQ